ncbi:hypothetical protein BGW39_004232 [Mortierella sp. 14UC]|nr:hypothetical protein BGW39_004232 [Mortierella sp. 14UC]
MLTDLRLYEINTIPEEWTRVLQYMALSKMTRFDVQQKNKFLPKTLLQIADVVPRSSSVLETFFVRDMHDNNCDTYAALEVKFGRSALLKRQEDDGAYISLNGFCV